MKTWKHRTAWRVLVLSVLLFAAVLYFHVTATPIAGTTKRANDITPTPRVQATKHANYIAPTPRVKTTTRSDYITRIFTDANGMHMTYYLYIPVNYDPQKKYPLVLLLHGGGESANVHNRPGQNRDVLLNQAYVRVWGPGHPGPGSPNVQEHWPSFIVVPQVVNPQRWVNVPAQQGSYTLAAQPTDSLRMAKEIVDALQKQYTNIDPDRLYITGLSMGGYGVWDAIERWPNYFAAAAPLAGAGDPSKASMLIHLPIWDFHGSQDATVPVSGSRDMIAAIKAAGGEPRYTEFPGEGHEVWNYAYSTAGTSTRVPDFFSWLFSQSKIRSTSLIQVK